MKVLIATKEGQGNKSNDFFHAKEGELVLFASECDGEEINGICGCRQSMVGMNSSKATTTFKVADIPMTRWNYFSEIRAHWEKTGWMKYLHETDVKKAGRELLSIASDFLTGAILERRGSEIKARRVK